MNIKIQGIPDSVDPTERSHYLRRVTATLFPHTQAKKLEFNGHFRINKAKQALPAALRDVIVRCQSILDRLCFLNAVTNNTPLDFESSRLTFFQDIKRTTLHWRKSLSPITAQLQNAKVDYRRLLPRTLPVVRNDTILKLISLAEAPTFLQALGLSQDTGAQETPSMSTHHTWDPERTVSFTPRGDRKKTAVT
ncbi:Hypothetical predicted protein [Pelobates cultripes]|uniref:Uncharacterized protein n=1 Tax=Pelobates cultripes TaxID=61616 RepID=A0AAD1QZ35_PELCU|nr:Hypothetical predicted protein [Pelobates cultripes]